MFEFLNSISDFFQFGIYGWFEETAIYLTSTLLIWWVKAQISSIEFAWGVAQQILQGFDVASKIALGFSQLPGDAAATAAFFRFPEAVSIILSGGATRFVLRMLPGF